MSKKSTDQGSQCVCGKKSPQKRILVSKGIRYVSICECKECDRRIVQKKMGGDILWQGAEQEAGDWIGWLGESSGKEILRYIFFNFRKLAKGLLRRLLILKGVFSWSARRPIASLSILVISLLGYGFSGVLAENSLKAWLENYEESRSDLSVPYSTYIPQDEVDRKIEEATAEKIRLNIESAQRVHDIGWKLFVAAWDVCKSSRPSIGLSLQRDDGYLAFVSKDNPASKMSDQGATVGFVPKGSPAELAGIRQGDILVSLEGVAMPADAAIFSEKNPVHETLRRLAADNWKTSRSIKVGFFRQGVRKETHVYPVMACPHKIVINKRDIVQASTDGTDLITFYHGYINSFYSDEEIAVVIGHEMGHTIVYSFLEELNGWIMWGTTFLLREESLEPEGIQRILFKHRKDHELASDAFALRLGKKAGFDTDKMSAAAAKRFLNMARDLDIIKDSSYHVGIALRLLAIEKVKNDLK